MAGVFSPARYPLEVADPVPAALLTPTEIRMLLADHGLSPRRSAGQNFVVDPNTVRRIVAAATLNANDTIVEVGPGLGSLTVALAATVKRVIAIEIDRGLAGALSAVLTSRSVDIERRVEVLHADALDVDFTSLGEQLRMVANLPYNVATPLVMHALEAGNVSDLFVMVQREVGERWVAQPGSRLRAAVSVKIDQMASAQIALAIPRQVFYPVPNVDSVMVRLVRRIGDDLAIADPDRRRHWTMFVDQAFAQRRKTLRNTLGQMFDRDVIEAAAQSAGVDLSARAETVPTARMVTMFETVERLVGWSGGSVAAAP